MNGIRLTQRPSLRQRVRLSQSQKLTLGQRVVTLRYGLLEALRGVRYDAGSQCPVCEKRLTAIEIVRGFRRDPNDYTTLCPHCKNRFAPKLMAHLGAGVHAEIAFYCALQTLEQLRNLGAVPIEILQHQYAAVYHSALSHFGSLVAAYGQIGISYTQQEIPDWKKKILPYLGALPDTVIAACAEVKVATVRRLRRSFEIEPYSARKLLEDIDT